MKKYKSPEIEIEELSTVDVICTSAGGNTGGSSGPKPGDNGSPILPVSLDDMTSGTGVDYGTSGISFGDVTGNF